MITRYKNLKSLAVRWNYMTLLALKLFDFSNLATVELKY